MEDAAPSRRRGALLPSLVVALGIFAYLMTASSILTTVDQLGRQYARPLEFVLVDAARTALLYAAFAAACFLSFWVVAPILARLTFGQLVLRVLVAAGTAFAVLVPIDFLVFSVMFAGNVPADDGGIYDVTYPSLDLGDVFVIAVKDAVQTAISRLPVITLAALALWWWLRRKESAHGEA